MQELKDVILTYNNYISNLPLGIKALTEKIREDNFSEALVDIKHFSEGMMWIVQAGELITKNNGFASIDVNRISSFLVEINEGLDLQDYTLVADIFEYELIPFCENLKPARAKL